MRDRTGKAARMTGIDFDRQAVNNIHDATAEAEELALKEQVAADAEAKAAEKAAESAELEAKAAAVEARHAEATE